MHLLTAHPFVTVSASARGEQGLVYAGRMHSWIVEQLPRILAEDLNIHAPKRGVFGAGAGCVARVCLMSCTNGGIKWIRRAAVRPPGTRPLRRTHRFVLRCYMVYLK